MKIIIKKKRPKWLRPLQSAGAVILVLIVYMMFRPQIEETTHEVAITPFMPDEVSRDGALIFANDITGELESYQWLDNLTFSFVGNHAKRGEGMYEIDLEALTLTTVTDTDPASSEASLAVEGKVPEHYDILAIRPNYTLFFIYDDALRGIYRMDNEGTVKRVSNKMLVDGDGFPYFVLSENGQKLLYLEDGTQKLVTYDFDTTKKKILSKALTEAQLNHLDDCITVSPSGGFVLLEDEDGLVYVYGSDSGKQYVEGVLAINSTFSAEDGYLYYFYEGAMNTDYAGTQLGIVNLNTGNITYDTAENDENYHVTLTGLPDSDAVLYMNGVVDGEQFIIESLETYDPSTEEKTKVSSLKGTVVQLNTPIIVRDQLMLLLTPDDDILLYQLNDQSTMQLTAVDTFSYKGEHVRYVPYSGGFIFAYGNALYRYDHLGTLKLMDFEGTLDMVSLSPNAATIAAYIKDQQIIFSDKMTEVY